MKSLAKHIVESFKISGKTDTNNPEIKELAQKLKIDEIYCKGFFDIFDRRYKYVDELCTKIGADFLHSDTLFWMLVILADMLVFDKKNAYEVFVIGTNNYRGMNNPYHYRYFGLAITKNDPTPILILIRDNMPKTSDIYQKLFLDIYGYIDEYAQVSEQPDIDYGNLMNYACKKYDEPK